MRPASEVEVKQLVEQRLDACEPELELLAVEVSSVRGSGMVRIFLDSPDGVTLDTCARVTGHLNELLRNFTVEVSSPGPERPLGKPAHFERFVGHRARIRTNEMIDGRNDFKGELLAAHSDAVTLGADWGTVTLNYSQMRRANLMPETGGNQGGNS